MAKNVKISLLGWPSHGAKFNGDYEAHVEQMIDYLKYQLRDVLPDKPDLIVVPEACDRFINFTMQERKEYYRVRGDKIRDFYSEVARENNCYIVTDYSKQYDPVMPLSSDNVVPTVDFKEVIIKLKYYER